MSIGASHQFIVRTFLRDAALVEEHDMIGDSYRGKAMGDDDHDAVLRGLKERSHEVLLGLGVESRGRLVQDQDARVLE